jgi:streptomycin 6-kinase
MFHIPDYFAREMLALHGGEDGRAWLERLPTILATCEVRWGLKIGAPFPNLSFNYVAPATYSGGSRAIVKVCSPTYEYVTERDALRHFDGHGMARLLACDDASEALLLEYLSPGTLLRDVEDDEAATSHAAGVMRALWRPAPQEHHFPTVQKWGLGFGRFRRRFDGSTGPIPPALFDKGEALYQQLCESMTESALLHGDLHHDNILAAERAPWLAIDPKGVIGEPAYETGALLRNPYPAILEQPQPGRILARRMAQLSEDLGFDRQRVRDWAVAQAVLSAVWGMEDFDTVPHEMIAIAELLAALHP